ncbi:EF-hand domain-containing protein [Sulfuriroseicoccus oceanibius]|uniref:EF-hand domain-containing protein n=1 Tax=Sulfuriroseicoccus oceanibius TaxID=2707525 RepID=A0A6B3L7H2_9BACT|nr:EF-hand domain-containing protein [Sulfuriroseicoccus oceanibius]QQL43682.1 EF-hand domain-containing protein [Sulfuriroseicoccus oceanibius]
MKYLVTLATASLALSLASCEKRDGFALADTDGNQSISYQEFDRFMLEAIYSSVDVDGDSKVTLEEYLASGSDATKEGFKKVDANGDGVITPEEAKAFWESQQTMKSLFKKIDTNGDGQLSQEEVKTFFDKAAKAEGKTDLEKLSNAASQ